MMSEADNLRRKADQLAAFLRTLPDSEDNMPGWAAVVAMRDAADSLDRQRESLDAWAAISVRRVATAIGGTVESFTDD